MTAVDKEQIFIDTEELAERWKMTPKSITNSRSKGRGPKYIRLGGVNSKVVYRLSDIEAFERDNTLGGDD